MTLKDVYRGQAQLLDGRIGTGIIRRHVIARDAGMPIALCLTEQAAQQMAREIEAQLCDLMEAVVQQAGQPPYSLLDIRLVLQNTSAGSTFLRWRTRDFTRMGVAVWERQVCNKALPQVVREGLRYFECNRIALNLQMSVVHSLYRQATTCAIKMDSAERLLRQFTTAVEISR